MATITLQNSSLMEVTILSNTFIDNYMPEANGEFVKYISTFYVHSPMLRFLSVWSRWQIVCCVPREIFSVH